MSNTGIMILGLLNTVMMAVCKFFGWFVDKN